MRTVFVGEAPGGKVDLTDRPELALTGAVGKRMASLAGVPFSAYLRHSERHNLFIASVPTPGWWDAKAARESALALAAKLHRRRVVVLGTKVASAFDVADRYLFQWRELMIGDSRLMVARAPHPSGRNRNLNELSARMDFGAFLHESLVGHPVDYPACVDFACEVHPWVP